MTTEPEAIPADVLELARAASWEGTLPKEVCAYEIAHAIMADRASRAPVDGAEADWRDDPSADERWNAGLDYGMQQFCKVLGVDPAEVTWDAATETLDGDVQAVIGNILRAWSGDDWIDLPATRELLLAGQGDDDAMQILPDFEEGDTVLVMVDRCLHLLERRRDVVEGFISSTHPAPASPDAEMVRVLRSLAEIAEIARRTTTDAGIQTQLSVDIEAARRLLSKHGGAK